MSASPRLRASRTYLFPVGLSFVVLGVAALLAAAALPGLGGS